MRNGRAPAPHNPIEYSVWVPCLPLRAEVVVTSDGKEALFFLNSAKNRRN